MGVKVNESGIIKNVTLDDYKVETFKVNISIPAVTANSANSFFKPSDFGITRAYRGHDTRENYTDALYTADLREEEAKSSYNYWPDIPDAYKVTLKRGKLNFKLSDAFKVQKLVNFSSEIFIWERTRFPEWTNDSPRGFNSAVYLYEIGNSSYIYRAYIALVLTIENEEDYRIDACLVYSSGFGETDALNAQYGYEGRGKSTVTRPYTWYLINNGYRITNLAYSEYPDYNTDPVLTK